MERTEKRKKSRKQLATAFGFGRLINNQSVFRDRNLYFKFETSCWDTGFRDLL